MLALLSQTYHMLGTCWLNEIIRTKKPSSSSLNSTFNNNILHPSFIWIVDNNKTSNIQVLTLTFSLIISLWVQTWQKISNKGVNRKTVSDSNRPYSCETCTHLTVYIIFCNLYAGFGFNVLISIYVSNIKKRTKAYSKSNIRKQKGSKGLENQYIP